MQRLRVPRPRSRRKSTGGGGPEAEPEALDTTELRAALNSELKKVEQALESNQ